MELDFLRILEVINRKCRKYCEQRELNGREMPLDHANREKTVFEWRRHIHNLRWQMFTSYIMIATS